MYYCVNTWVLPHMYNLRTVLQFSHKGISWIFHICFFIWPFKIFFFVSSNTSFKFTFALSLKFDIANQYDQHDIMVILVCKISGSYDYQTPPKLYCDYELQVRTQQGRWLPLWLLYMCNGEPKNPGYSCKCFPIKYQSSTPQFKSWVLKIDLLYPLLSNSTLSYSRSATKMLTYQAPPTPSPCVPSILDRRG